MPQRNAAASVLHHGEPEAGQVQMEGVSLDTPPDEKRQGPRPASLHADSPILHLHLTFETALPTVPTAQHDDAQHLGKKLPPCPDLRPYISPLKWSPVRKNVLLAMSCVATFLTAYTAGAYSPPATAMAQDLGTSRLVILVGITTFCLGFGLAPMALAPISEIYGRFPVFAVAGVVFVAFQAVCPAMTSAAGLLTARFLVGVGASVFSAVVGGAIADLWDKKDRNTPMALFSGAVLVGTGAGPLVATALMQDVRHPTLAWKRTFWHQVIMGVVLVAVIFLFCKESRASVLLTRKAKVLNKWCEELEEQGVYGLVTPTSTMMAAAASSSSSSDESILGHLEDDGGAAYHAQGRDGLGPNRLRRVRWLVEEDEKRPAIAEMIAFSVQRPFHMLFTEPIVFCFSLWAAFSWGILYLSFSVVPFLYGTDFGRTSRVYVAIMVAGVVATSVSILQQRLLQHPQWRVHDDGFRYSDSKLWALMRRKFPAESPEARLYFACVTALLLPAGLFGAFMSSRGTDGTAEAIGLGFALCGIYSVYLATFNYLADAYGPFASSALAAQSFCRNMLGGSFPLITGAMFTNLGLKGAGGLLGGIAAALTAIPWVLVFWGETIRARSKFAISLQQAT